MNFFSLASTTEDHDDHDHEHGLSESTTIVIVKVCFLVIMPVLVIACSLLPFCLSLCAKFQRIGKLVHGILDVGQGFAAGILVAGAILHIYPEAVESMSTNILAVGGSEAVAHYPFVGLLALLAFCFIYFSEFFLGKCMELHTTRSKKRRHHHHHSAEEGDSHNHVGTSANKVSTSDNIVPPETDSASNEQSDMVLEHKHDVVELIDTPSMEEGNGVTPRQSQDVNLIEVSSNDISYAQRPRTSSAHSSHQHGTSPRASPDETAPMLSNGTNTLTCRRHSATDAEDGRSLVATPPEDSQNESHDMCLSHKPQKFHDHHTHHFDLLVDHHASLAQIVTRGLVLWLSLSLHSFLGGLGLGSETNASAMWTLIVAIVVHKLFEAYALGDVLREGMKKKKVLIAVALIVMYSITTSVGVAIGMGVSLVDNPWFQLVSTVLLAFAVGALLHVGLFELLFHHMISETTLYITIPYLILFMVGVAGVAVMSIFHDATHGHEHSH